MLPNDIGKSDVLKDFVDVEDVLWMKNMPLSNNQVGLYLSHAVDACLINCRFLLF